MADQHQKIKDRLRELAAKKKAADAKREAERETMAERDKRIMNTPSAWERAGG